MDDVVAWSNKAWEIIARMTIFRELITGGFNYPLEPATAHTPEARERVKRFEKELRELLEELKILVQICEQDFRKFCHVCRLESCKSWCTVASWSERFAKVWTKLIAMCIPNSANVAVKRFLSWSSLLAGLTITVVIGELGPEGWGRLHPNDDIEKMYANDVVALEGRELDESQQERRDKAVRVYGVSKAWQKVEMRAYMTFANVTRMAEDTLYRYLDRADSVKNRASGYTPVLLSIVADKVSHNPLKIYYRDVVAMMRAGSDLHWLFAQWHRATGGSDAFWWTQGWRVLRLILGPYSEIKAKLGLMLENEARFLVWKIVSAQHFHGKHSGEAIEHARRAQAIRKCCEDVDFTLPVLKRPRMPLMSLLDSTELECLGASAPDCCPMNLDAERRIRGIRSFTYGDQKRTLTTVATQTVVFDLRTEHEKRGGITVCGSVSSDEVQSWQIDAFQRRQSAKQAPSIWNGWTAYIKDHILPRWEQQQSKQEIQLRGGQSRPAKHKYLCRSDEAGTDGWRRGRGDWESWEAFLRRMSERWHANPEMQQRYRMSALEHNAEDRRVEQAIPPPPAVNASSTWLQLGSLTSPLRPELLMETVDEWTPNVPSTHPSARRLPGPVRAGRAIRAAQGARSFIADPLKPKTRLERIQLKTTCFEMHPMLCQSDPQQTIVGITQAICQNMNTLCSRHKADSLICRVVRVSWVASSLAEPTEYHYFFSMIMLGHCRLVQPQYQTMFPLQSTGDTYRIAFNKDQDDTHANFSYGVVKTMAENISRMDLVVRSCWCCEAALAPVPKSEHGFLHLQVVSPEFVNINCKPLVKEASPGLCIYPKLLDRELREVEKQDAKADPITDPHGAAFEEEVKETDRLRKQQVAKYLEEFKRKLFLGRDVKARKEQRAAKTPRTQRLGKKGDGEKELKEQCPENEVGDLAAEASGEDELEDYDPSWLSEVEDGNNDSYEPMPWEDVAWQRARALPNPGDVPRPDPGAARFLKSNRQGERRPAGEPEALRKLLGDDVDKMVRLLKEKDDADNAAKEKRKLRVDPEYRSPKADRQIGTFGPHAISLYVPGGGSNHNATAVSLVCGRHQDSPHYRKSGAKLVPCRRNLAIKDLDEIPAQVRRLKRWAILGHRWSCTCPEVTGVESCGAMPAQCVSRSKHMALNYRCSDKDELKPYKEDLDMLVAANIFEEDEVEELRDDVAPRPSAA